MFLRFLTNVTHGICKSAKWLANHFEREVIKLLHEVLTQYMTVA